jgi:hypothetical protein
MFTLTGCPTEDDGGGGGSTITYEGGADGQRKISITGAANGTGFQNSSASDLKIYTIETTTQVAKGGSYSVSASQTETGTWTLVQMDGSTAYTAATAVKIELTLSSGSAAGTYTIDKVELKEVTTNIPFSLLTKSGGGPSGVSWTAVDDSKFGSSNNSIYGIAWGGNKFVAVGNRGKIAYSTDGTDWTGGNISTFGSSTISGIAWGGGSGQEKFVAGSYGGKMATSTNGTSWTEASNSPFGNSGISINSIAWVGASSSEKFFAVGDGGVMGYSTDGTSTTWIKVDNSKIGGHIYGIAWGGGTFVAVGEDGKMAYWDGATE